MPARCAIDPRLEGLMRYQDWVVSRDQALAAGLTPRAIGHRLSGASWQSILPGVYTVGPASPTRRQQLVAALLFAGPDAVIDGADACRLHGLRQAVTDDQRVDVLIPWGREARSRGFVRIRRTTKPIPVTTTGLLRVLAPAPAVIAATRRLRRHDRVLALMSDAVQRRVVSYEELVVAHVGGARANGRLADRALAALCSGAESLPEVDVLRLVAASAVLPEPFCNVGMRLPGGQVVRPDAWFPGSALIHETNGRSAHERADLFGDMQRRHDVLTAAGFTVLHNSPDRIRQHPREVVHELERCFQRLDGGGLPPGVTVLTTLMAG